MEYSFREVPFELQKRVIAWFWYVWNQGEAAVDEKAIEDFLPSCIYNDLLINIHMDILKKVKLFEDCETGLLSELILLLTLRVYSPGDYICRKGDIGKEMYIVKMGQLEVVSEDGKKVFVTLKEGSVFGELSILEIPGNKNGNRRTAGVRSVGFSDLYILKKEDLWEVLSEYSEARQRLVAKGEDLLRKDNLLIEDKKISTNERCTTFKEKLTAIQKAINFLDKQIKEFYDEYTVLDADSKQRLTKLENVLQGCMKKNQKSMLINAWSNENLSRNLQMT